MEFSEYKCKKASDLILINERLSGWIFRGQSHSQWPLQTTLERAAVENFVSDLHHYEKFIISKFKQNSHLYGVNEPQETNMIDWASVIQHHGGPTRLLDFTESLFVSCFFATALSDDESVIWAVDLNPFFPESADFYRSSNFPPDKIKHGFPLYDYGYRQRSKAIELDEKELGVYIARPMWGNERLFLQQGLFMVQRNIQKYTFQDNLFSSLGIEKEKPVNYKNIEEINPCKSKIIRIVIPNDLDLKFNIFKLLRSMNISDATLFPGIDGFTRSLKYMQEYAYHSTLKLCGNLKQHRETIAHNRFNKE